MYRRKDRRTQALFKELMPFGGQLDPNNRWLKLKKLIPWEELEDEYAKYFSDIGRPALDGRLVTGILCIKHKKKTSDKEVMQDVLENPYMQSFCGLESFATKELFDKSSLSKLRKRLGRKYFRKLEKGVERILKRHGLINARGMLVDATVFPCEIRYPTDIGLLNEVRLWLDKNIKAACEYFGIDKKKVRTYPRRAKKEYLNFAKKRKKGKKTVKHAKKKMLGYMKRNIGHMKWLLEELKKSGEELRKGFSERFETALKIYEQQKEMYENGTHRVKNRIVSFHQPQVRPIVRGKDGKKVEFGPKGVMNYVDGYAFLDCIENDNFNEAVRLPESIQAYEERFGRKPKDVTADLIYGNRENRRYLKEEGIRVALKPLGRKAQTEEGVKHRQWVKKKQRQRNWIEGIIGHGKEHYGLDRIRYKIKGGEEIWVRLSLLMMNLDTAVKRT